MTIIVTSTSAPLYDYTALKTAVASWLHRADLESKIPDFITLAEAKFNRALRVEEMVSVHSATAADSAITLPTDYLEAISLEVAGNAYDFRPASVFFELEGRYYTRRGNQLVLADAGGDVTLHYYAQIPGLSTGNPSNWLLEKAPDLYLYSALLEAAPYIKDDARLAVWGSARQAVLDAIQSANDASRYSGRALTISIAR